jgi:ribosomal protein L40E
VVTAPKPVVAEQEAEPIVAEPVVAPEPEPVVAEPVVALEPEPVLAIELEPEPLVVAPEPEPVVAVELEPEPVVVGPEPEPESVVVEPEAEPVASAYEPEPEPVVVEAEPEPRPIVAASEVGPEPEPRTDFVPQPTWQIVAPDSPTADGATAPPVQQPPAQPPADAVAASAEPQWPDQPQWPGREGAAGLPFLGRAPAATGGIEALWAASAQEVAQVPATETARVRSGIQPCISCGLSLSANARFCRRCGTRQT